MVFSSSNCRAVPVLLLLLLSLLLHPRVSCAGLLPHALLRSSNDDNDDDAVTAVSFQGQHAKEHYTMQVEKGHQLVCFQSKDELQAAVNEYSAYNHVDMSLAEKYGWPIGNWCTSQVEDFSDLFYDRADFNEDIGMWDVSKATDMTAMFQNALEFNQDISEWDTSKVKSMSRMFAAAKSFNADISKWNVEQVTSTSYMFLHALEFNQPLQHWQMPHNQDMERMFRDARKFVFREDVQKAWKLHDAESSSSDTIINTHRMLNIDCGEF